MTTYFISDIHLSDQDHTCELLLKFLREQAIHAEALYILGDLFAIWFGDDLDLPYARELYNALQQLKSQNIALYFMRGNRDFLIGKQFCANTGSQLLNDPCVIDLYGQKVLLTHGDLLCTQDTSYQRFRKVVQNPLVKSCFLILPKTWRIKIGHWVKRHVMQSSTKTGNYKPAIFDVDQATVEQWLKKYQVASMIHGHTHRPGLHKSGMTTRYVLGDWQAPTIKILKVDKQNFNLIGL